MEPEIEKDVGVAADVFNEAQHIQDEIMKLLSEV